VTARRAFTDRMTGLLQLGGFGSLSAAAWELSSAAGKAAVGVSLLLVAWLTDPPRPAR
jgi:hypothetical protein